MTPIYRDLQINIAIKMVTKKYRTSIRFSGKKGVTIGVNKYNNTVRDVVITIFLKVLKISLEAFRSYNSKTVPVNVMYKLRTNDHDQCIVVTEK